MTSQDWGTGYLQPTQQLSRDHIFLVGPSHDDLKRLIRQRPLQRLRLTPRRAHPDIALLIGRQDHRIAFGWIGSTTAFGDVVRKLQQPR
jgi:hypothetical protein